MTLVAPPPLDLKQPNAIDVWNAPPGQRIYLCAGLAAFYSTPYLPLGVVMSLPGAYSRPVAGPVFADANGNATLTMTPPRWVYGRTLYLQALTAGEVSNVSGTWLP
jgi:hypothetical protein